MGADKLKFNRRPVAIDVYHKTWNGLSHPGNYNALII